MVAETTSLICILFVTAIHRENGVVQMQMCKSCSLEIEHSRSALPPVNSIANGNYIGRLPSSFDSLTRTDEQAISLVSPCMSLSTVTGGACRTIKSHHYVVRNTEGPIADMLPRDLRSNVRVTMVGNMTPAQAAQCKKRYKLNVDLCSRFLSFLYENNREYQRYRHSISKNTGDLDSASVVEDSSKTTSDTTNGDDHVVEMIRDEESYSGGGSYVREGSDTALEGTWISASSLILEKDQRWTDILVRKSSAYVPLTRWAVCVQMFPSLFPGGCAGPTETRQRPMSVQSWIQRCLMVHGQRFETHYAFLLLAFDYLASQSARNTLFLKMNVSAHALDAGRISQETVNILIKYYNDMIDAKTHGMRSPQPPRELQAIKDVRNGLRAPESAFYGSNLSRMRARHDLFGLLKRFGPMQLFFTVSPDSAGTYNIAIKAGAVAKDSIDHINRVLLPNRAERKAIAAKHPYQCARYFQRVMDTVIDVLLGWDQKTCRPKREGGVFGVVRGFGAAAETQVAGDLHAHFAVWLYGFPQSSADLRHALESDEAFRSRLVKLTNAVLTTSPPCLQQQMDCPHCGGPELTPVLPGIDAFRRPAPGETAPVTSRCNTCKSEFRDRDIINSAIEALADVENVEIDNAFVDYCKCKPPCVDSGNCSRLSLELSIVVREVQVHYWNHCRSCFKVSIFVDVLFLCVELICLYGLPVRADNSSNAQR